MTDLQKPASPPLGPGDRIPPFRVRANVNPVFNFDNVAGRWNVLYFPGTLAAEPSRARLEALRAEAGLFDDAQASLFVVSNDPADETTGRLTDRIPGQRVLWDLDLAVARTFGLIAMGPQGPALRPAFVVIDPGHFIRKVIHVSPDGADLAELVGYLRRAHPVASYMGFAVPAPILVLPDVFEPGFCDRLVALYDEKGGEISGFMRDVGGKTVPVNDPSFKVRRDVLIEDETLRRAVQDRIMRRVISQIERVHFFRATRMERYLVACYDSAEGGHFNPHRDNTTLGTAHRRFAVSINLNDDFEGGAVSFPEYGPTGYKAPKGGAVIFSCALLHAVSTVTAGRRYAFLPFLYDDAAARIREQNARHVASG